MGPQDEIKMHKKGVMGLATNRHYTRLFSAGLDQNIKIFDTVKFKLLHQINIKSAIMDVQLSNDGQHIACGLMSGKLIIKSFKGIMGEIKNLGEYQLFFRE